MNAAEPTMELSANGRESAAPTRKASRLWWWFVAAFALQIGAWTAWLVIAAQHRVAEVPLAVKPAR